MLKRLRIHFSSIDSTNRWAKDNLRDLDPQALTVVTTDVQTAGRGRQGRKWVSLPGENLFASFVWFEEGLPAYTPNVGQVLGVTVCDAFPEIPFKLKWPNDLLLSGKKCGGILCETSGGAIVAGIGLNVNCEQEQLPDLGQPSTSVKIETGKIYDLNALVEKLHKDFANSIERLRTEGFSAFLERYRSLVVHAGRHGEIHEILPDGAIVLRTPEGLKTYRDAP